MPSIALTAGITIAVLATACLLLLRLPSMIRQRNTNTIVVSRPWKAEARRLPGSMCLPILGETLQFFARSPSLQLPGFFKRRLDRYGPVFRTSIVGEELIVSLDPELNNLVFQQEEKLFQIWYPDSFMRIIGADSIVTALGSSHKHIRSLVLRLFGPENLRRAMLHELHETAQASLLSWLHQPAVQLKEAVCSMIFSVTAKKLISYDSPASDGKMWKQYDAFVRGLVAFPLYIPGTAFYKCMQGRRSVMNMLRICSTRGRRKRAVRRTTTSWMSSSRS
uniref:Cytochrome P450 n=1 Tax=Oryza brachyantha TaxID=4533 RepID=J3LRB2_ORYBR